MTLQQLIQQVDETVFKDSKLFLHLKSVKPDFGSRNRIQVKRTGDRIIVTNIHVGGMADILNYPIDVDKNIELSPEELLTLILQELEEHPQGSSYADDFWDDMTNLQKAKIVR